jgi:hypothetical protein
MSSMADTPSARFIRIRKSFRGYQTPLKPAQHL